MTKTPEAAPTTPDPIEIAMEAEATGEAPRGVAHRVLAKQEQLIGWEIADRRAAFALKLLTAFAGLAVVAVLGAMAWRASEAGGLVVEAFVVPPQFAEDGLTGEVLARDVLDRLAQLDRETNSVFVTKVTDSWSNSTKIELAQTGLSLDDLDRLLRRWLGDETYVRGELVRTPTGVRLTGRTTAGAPATVEGPATELQALTQQLAERIYRNVKPNGYAEWLIRQQRSEEAGPVLHQVLAVADDLHSRTLAYDLLGIVSRNSGDARGAVAYYDAATRSPDPTLAAIAAANAAMVEGLLGHTEAQRRQQERANAFARKGWRHIGELQRNSFKVARLASEFDYLGAERQARPAVDRLVPGTRVGAGRSEHAGLLANLHELSAVGRLKEPPPFMRPLPALWANDAWPDVLAAHALLPLRIQGQPATRAYQAMALAKLGRLDEAGALVATLPLDCDVCHGAKGILLAAQGDVAGSERAFAEALRLAPNSVTLLIARGRERLARGDAPSAAADFRRANKLAPAFADPLAYWGEALLAQGDAQGASAQFADAASRAPRWGRLHLKWGAALAKLGKADEARAKWRAAAAMDLSPADRAALKAHGV